MLTLPTRAHHRQADDWQRTDGGVWLPRNPMRGAGMVRRGMGFGFEPAGCCCGEEVVPVICQRCQTITTQDLVVSGDWSLTFSEESPSCQIDFIGPWNVEYTGVNPYTGGTNWGFTCYEIPDEDSECQNSQWCVQFSISFSCTGTTNNWLLRVVLKVCNRVADPTCNACDIMFAHSDVNYLISKTGAATGECFDVDSDENGELVLSRPGPGSLGAGLTGNFPETMTLTKP